MLTRFRKPIINWLRHYTKMSDFYFVRNLPIIRYSVLSNGLTVATEERKTSNVCIGFYINSGSRFENELSNGMTHFFEHIVFKGSKKRDKTSLYEEISKTGAKFKCFTTRQVTVYYVICLALDLPRVADILFDGIFNNAFFNTEIEFEKNVVYTEMLKHDISTVKVLYDNLHLTAFQGTPLAQTVMGPSKNLKYFNSNNLSNHLDKMFTPQRIVLAAVGGIKHEFIISLGEQYLGNVKCDEKNICLGPMRYTGSEIIYRDDTIPLAHIAIAIEGPSFSAEDRLIMDLVALLLGGWDASQPCGANHGTHLAHIVSAGGLCESYKAFNLYYQDIGLCGIEFISPKLETDDMIMTIQDEWMRLCHMITDGDLLRAKNELKSKILNKVQTIAGAFHDIGLHVLQTGSRPAIYEQMQVIDDITTEKFKNVCERYFYDKCPVVAGIGATECLLPYTKTRGYMYWLRV